MLHCFPFLYFLTLGVWASVRWPSAWMACFCPHPVIQRRCISSNLRLWKKSRFQRCLRVFQGKGFKIALTQQDEFSKVDRLLLNTSVKERAYEVTWESAAVAELRIVPPVNREGISAEEKLPCGAALRSSVTFVLHLFWHLYGTSYLGNASQLPIRAFKGSFVKYC